MLATRKLRVGDGYQYLSRQVAAGDVQIARDQALADYPLEITKKREQLTRATRPAKVLRPIGELFEEWANRARALTGLEPHDLAARALVGDYSRRLNARDVADETYDALVAQVIGDAQARAATFTAWNLAAAAGRATRELRMASPDERIRLVARLVIARACRACAARRDTSRRRRRRAGRPTSCEVHRHHRKSSGPCSSRRRCAPRQLSRSFGGHSTGRPGHALLLLLDSGPVPVADLPGADRLAELDGHLPKHADGPVRAAGNPDRRGNYHVGVGL